MSRYSLGIESSIECQQASVGVYKDQHKLLVLDIDAYGQCTTFQSIKFCGEIIVVGFGETVFFFDVSKLTAISRKMEGYFNDLYTPDDFGLPVNAFAILAASASHLHHFTFQGKEIWRSVGIGIDGVIVDSV